MSFSIANGSAKEHGRSGLILQSNYLKKYRSTTTDYYNVTKRESTDDFNPSDIIVPFPITLRSATTGGSEKTVYAVIGDGQIKFTYVDYPCSLSVFSRMTNNAYDTQFYISGWSTERRPHWLYLNFPCSWSMYNDSDKDSRVYTYASPNNDFFIYRAEYAKSSKSYARWVEITLTNKGDIQLVCERGGSYTNTLYTSNDEYFETLGSEYLKCSDGACGYSVGAIGVHRLLIKGTATHTGTLSLTFDWGNVSQKVDFNVTVGMTATQLSTLIANSASSYPRTNLATGTDTDGNVYVQFTAKAVGETDLDISQSVSLGFSKLSTQTVTNGEDQTTCNYYSTSRAQCAYNAKKTSHTYAGTISSYTLTGSKFGFMTILYADGSLSSPDSNKHISYTDVGDVNFAGSIEIASGSSNTLGRFINIYKGDNVCKNAGGTKVYTPLSINTPKGIAKIPFWVFIKVDWQVQLF